MDFSDTIAACDLKLIELMKIRVRATVRKLRQMRRKNRFGTMILTFAKAICEKNIN